MKQRGLAPILIIVLLAAVVGGYLIGAGKINLPQKQTEQSKTSEVDETASWKTYTNTKFAYEIKYPSNIAISNQLMPGDKSEESSGFDMVLDGGSPSYKTGSIEVIDPEIKVLTPSGDNSVNLKLKWKNLILEEFVHKIWQLNMEDKNPYISNKQTGSILETRIAGRKAYQFNLTGSYIIHRGGGTLKEEYLLTFLEKNKKIYFFMTPSKNKTFDQIISTFKFLDQK